MEKIHIVGSGTPTPTPTRFGTCYVFQIDDEFLMFDCGPAATHKLVKLGIFPTQVVETGTVTGATFLDGFFKGVGQVMFQNNIWTGVFFLVGILANSTISFSFACAGTFLSLVTTLVLGAE